MSLTIDVNQSGQGKWEVALGGPLDSDTAPHQL